TGTPSNLISPDDGLRSPAIRPNRLLFPAPLGPTIPMRSPAPTISDRLSATTTLPKLFDIPASSSRAVPAASRIRWLELRLDLDSGVQVVVDDLHLERILACGLLPLHADRVNDRHARRRPVTEVQRAAHSRVADLMQGRGDLGRIVRVADLGEGLLGD